MARKLMATRAAFFASPEYMARSPKLRTPDDLRRHPTLALRITNPKWRIQNDKTGATAPAPALADLAVAANDFSVLLASAIAGLGVAFLPILFASPHVESGELQRVLPRWSSGGGQFNLLWPASRYVAPRVRVFIDHVADFFGSRC